MAKPVAGRPETVVLARMLELDGLYGDSDDESDAGLLVHEELRFFRVMDTRAQDVVKHFKDDSCPFSGHRRIGNALRSLKNKRLVERTRVDAGTYRYYLTQLGRDRLDEFAPTPKREVVVA